MPTTEVTTAAAMTTSECTAIFVSLELSRSTWLMTALAAPLGAKMSRHQVRGGDVPELLKRFSDLQRAVQRRTGQVVPVIVIQEAGLDGFWIHRALVAAGIESHVVDPASIAVSRRHRRAKTDRIDGAALVRTLMAWRRGDPRVCAMVSVPSPEEEDRRCVCRELKSLIGERIRHVNRVKGVLFAQGIGDYEPRNKDRRNRLEELRTGDGRPLPHHLKALVLCELEIIELLNRQIETVKSERDALLAEMQTIGSAPTPVRMLLDLKGIGPGFAGALWSEGLFRTFKEQAPDRGLCRARTDTVEERHDQPRTRRLQGGQSPSVGHCRGNGLALALAAAPTGIGARSMVPRQSPPAWSTHQKGHDCRAGAETACSFVEIRDQRCRDRGGGYEDGVTVSPKIRDSSVPPGPDQPRRIRADGPANGMARNSRS